MKSSLIQSIFLTCAIIFTRVLICSCLGVEINLAKASLDSEHIVYSPEEEKKRKPHFVPDDKPDHLMWFIQVNNSKM